MRVAVVGAGAAGLASARHASSRGFHCVVFERTPHVGGTWVYSDRVGVDDDGLPVHTSMYKGLRTNLPKEVMGFPDYPIPESELSYLPAEEILQFLNDYADHFRVRELIKFEHYVTNITIQGNTWEVRAKNLRTGDEIVEEFDAVMICNGHYWQPFIPEIPGAENFKGRQIHSHDYRSPESFSGRRMLVVGAGPSGMDLALHCAPSAQKVILSHHLQTPIATIYPDNVIQKPDVQVILEDSVTFKDGTSELIDDILYCTGYNYSFPFLSEECGIKVENNHVQPLYLHMLNIKRPTLCFIGLPFYVCAFSLFDLQARFFLSVLAGEHSLPSEAEMLADAEEESARRLAAGLGARAAHCMGEMQGEYYAKVAAVAHLQPLPPVLTALHNESSRRFLEDLVNFRQDVYRIVDENTYVQIK